MIDVSRVKLSEGSVLSALMKAKDDAFMESLIEADTCLLSSEDYHDLLLEIANYLDWRTGKTERYLHVFGMIVAVAPMPLPRHVAVLIRH